MKILMVVHNFPPHTFAGVELHVYDLARVLAERNEVHVLYRVEDPDAREFTLTRSTYEGVGVIRVVSNLTAQDPGDPEVSTGLRNVFGEVLRELAPDVVHFHHLLFLSADLPLEARALGFPTLVTLHDYWYLCCRIQLYVPGQGRCEGPSVFRCAGCFDHPNRLVRAARRFATLLDGIAGPWLEGTRLLDERSVFRYHARRIRRNRAVLRSYDVLLANSEHLRRRYLRFGAPENRTRVIRLGMDTAVLRRSRHEPGAKVRFGYVGSIVEHKGLQVLLEAFRRVPEATLEIHGNCELNEAVRAFRAGLEPPPNVRFMGGFDHREIGRVLERIDVLVVPSLWEEAYGLSVDEAKAAGIPVLASRIGGIPEHLVEGKEGFLFTPGSADELERLVRRLAGRPDRVRALRPTGDDVVTLFEQGEDVEAVYRTLVSEHTRAKNRGASARPGNEERFRGGNP